MTDPNAAAEPRIEQSDAFPCSACGGTMVFEPSTQKLSCSYCGHKLDVAGGEGEEDADIREYALDLSEEKAVKDWGREQRLIKCGSCGAETVLDVNAVAQFCAFCGSPHVVRQDGSAGITPESLVPFKITREQVFALFGAWIKKRFFAPRALRDNHEINRVNGVYLPFWTYDADTHSVYVGEAGTYYYETETAWVNQNGQRKQVTRQVRKTRWWPTAGTYAEAFDDILIPASRQIEHGLVAKLEPFHLEELKQYKPDYLSGFLAERYNVSLADGWEKAQEIMRDRIRQGVIRQIKADTVRNLRIKTAWCNLKYKHILLPVWVASYLYGGKTYRFMVNGQTGEVQGQAPVSPWKVLALLLGIAAIIAIVVLIARNR